MCKDTERIFKEFHQFLDEHGQEDMDPDEMERLLDQFLAQYDSQLDTRPEEGGFQIPMCADDYLELAEEAGSKKKKRELLCKALELEPDNLDALHELAEVDFKDPNQFLTRLRELLKKADTQMEREGYFMENMGDFWLVFETRPYMRLRHHYFQTLINCGMMRSAAAEGEAMLELCENDNLGVRFSLMHIYAFLEDEEAAVALHKRFEENDGTQMLLPLAMLYYKAGKEETAAAYLKRLASSNKDTKKFFSAMCSNSPDSLYSCLDEMSPYGYRPFSIEEYIEELTENDFCFQNADAFFHWGREILKKKAGKK